MDLPIKIAISIFAISVLLIFFKVTKKIGQNYSNKQPTTLEQPIHDYDQILNDIEHQDDIPMEEFNWEIPQI